MRWEKGARELRTPTAAVGKLKLHGSSFLHNVIRKYLAGRCLSSRAFLCLYVLGAVPAHGQSPTPVVHIKMVDGRTGQPIRDAELSIENASGHRVFVTRTSDRGIASLQVAKNEILLVHNTDKYVSCADETGGFVHNDYHVSEITTTGIVQLIKQPNLCTKAVGAREKNVLLLFFRPWRLGEKL